MSLRTLFTRGAQLSARLSPSTPTATRQLSTAPRLFADNVNHRANDTAEAHRELQKSKPLGPHMTNTNSTIANELPSVGADKAPPELLTSVDGDVAPVDSVPENTERMTGGTQKQAGGSGGANANASPNAELGVGEIEGGSFRVEPLRREGEEANTMRARLLCPLLLPCPCPLPFLLARPSMPHSIPSTH